MTTAGRFGRRAEAAQTNFRYFDGGDIGISLDETTSTEDVEKIVEVFSAVQGLERTTHDTADFAAVAFPLAVRRTSHSWDIPSSTVITQSCR